MKEIKKVRLFANHNDQSKKEQFQKRYDEAEAILKNYIENAKPKIVRPIGYPLLISVYDNNNNPEQAISVSKEFLAKYPDNYLFPSVMETLARLYELSGIREKRPSRGKRSNGKPTQIQHT